MGKPKLRSSIKALHQALLSFRPSGCKTITWVCIQHARTDSFRDTCNNFAPMRCSHSSSISSDLCSTNEESEHYSTDNRLPSTEQTSLSDSDESHSPESALKGFISSKRFFFTPCTTKSIMEGDSEHSDPASEDGAEMGIREMAFPESPCHGTDEEGWEEEQGVEMEMGFCRESLKMAIASMDPFVDFRTSMEEMVVAHGLGLRDWSCLKDLLHCYLSLNDEKIHKIIISAFADLIINLNKQETDEDGSTSSSGSDGKEISLPFSLFLQSWKERTRENLAKQSTNGG